MQALKMEAKIRQSPELPGCSACIQSKSEYFWVRHLGRAEVCLHHMRSLLLVCLLLTPTESCPRWSKQTPHFTVSADTATKQSRGTGRCIPLPKTATSLKHCQVNSVRDRTQKAIRCAQRLLRGEEAADLHPLVLKLGLSSAAEQVHVARPLAELACCWSCGSPLDQRLLPRALKFKDDETFRKSKALATWRSLSKACRST